MSATVPVSLTVRCSGAGVPGSTVRPNSLAKVRTRLDGVGVGGVALAVLRRG